MNDPQLAAALRSSSPDALPELLDAYGDQLFSYCWCLLRNRENAQIAVRDALVVATAQIGRLFCDEWLGLWLYSLARAECLRREAVPAADADEPVALLNTDDADSRLTAWKAITSMPADEVEALELDSRHDVDLRLVLGLSAAEVQALLDRARRDLERALGAEILISKRPACPDRAALLTGWTGATTPALRDRMLEHAATCSVCGPNLPRSVSPARVFALLPAPGLSSVARLEILGFFDDSRKAAFREFTVSRAEEVPGSWFLSTPESAEPAEPATGSWFIPAPEPAVPAPEPAATAQPPEPSSEPPEPSSEPPEPSSASAPGDATGPASSAAASAPGDVAGPVRSGPVVAQGFMGSWPSLADPADPQPEPLAPPPKPQPAVAPTRSWTARAARTPLAVHDDPAAVAPERLAPVIPLAAGPPAGPAAPRRSRPAAAAAGAAGA
ncbi:MAG: RNA polymerase sigma factor, partial [Streptosporangiaceae bacterium]